MKLTRPTVKPRNPIARALASRHGGAHQRPSSGRRQVAQRALANELAHLDHRTP